MLGCRLPRSDHSINLFRPLVLLTLYIHFASYSSLPLTKKSIKKWRSKELPINNNKNVDSNLLRELDIKIIVYILRDMAALDKQTQSHVAVIACPTCWTSETATTMNKSKTKKKWDAKKKAPRINTFWTIQTHPKIFIFNEYLKLRYRWPRRRAMPGCWWQDR